MVSSIGTRQFSHYIPKGLAITIYDDKKRFQITLEAAKNTWHTTCHKCKGLNNKILKLYLHHHNIDHDPQLILTGVDRQINRFKFSKVWNWNFYQRCHENCDRKHGTHFGHQNDCQRVFSEFSQREATMYIDNAGINCPFPTPFLLFWDTAL